MDTREKDARHPESDNVAEGKTNMDLDETPGRKENPEDEGKDFETDNYENNSRNEENEDEEKDNQDKEYDDLDQESNNPDEEEDANDVNYKLYNENSEENGDASPGI